MYLASWHAAFMNFQIGIFYRNHPNQEIFFQKVWYAILDILNGGRTRENGDPMSWLTGGVHGFEIFGSGVITILSILTCDVQGFQITGRFFETRKMLVIRRLFTLQCRNGDQSLSVDIYATICCFWTGFLLIFVTAHLLTVLTQKALLDWIIEIR